jgi:hypothetical protein
VTAVERLAWMARVVAAMNFKHRGPVDVLVDDAGTVMATMPDIAVAAFCGHASAYADALESLTADRDRWRREFEAAAKYVEENARLWAEVRRLERALAGGVGPLADSDAGARDSEEGCGAMASSGNRIPHG